MFSHNYFNKFVERLEETRSTFFTAIENKDYVTARSLLDKQFEIIHTMRELGRKAYEELDISSFGYANNCADIFENRLRLDVLDFIDELIGNDNEWKETR